ncbi:MAG TPA: FAD:protein FMN transferase [Streptosporangiaceae bacterium]
MTATAAARATFSVFGTMAVLLVTDQSALGAARLLADAELAAVDLACNRFRPDSELTQLNEAGGAARPVSLLFADLIATALRAAELTDGLVDPTCAAALASLGYDRDFSELAAGYAGPAGRGDEGPVTSEQSPATGEQNPATGEQSPVDGEAGPVTGWRSVELNLAGPSVQLRHGAQLDLGATAKARAADRCAGLIAEELGCGVLVSLGGDISVAGPAPTGGWQVRVTDDHAAGPESPGQTVAITGGGLATSSTTVRTWLADGRRVHHIIDPATGQPAQPCWRTVSVTAGSCVDANTASTAAIIRGESAPAWLADCGLPARLVRPDGTVVTAGGWPPEDQTTDPPGRGNEAGDPAGAAG